MENYQCSIVDKVYVSAESSFHASLRALNLPSLFLVVHALPQDLPSHEATAKTGPWDGAISFCLADNQEPLPKDRLSVTRDACQTMLNATYYPWCLESQWGGCGSRWVGSLDIQHGGEGWLPMQRFPIRSSLSRTIGADERSSLSSPYCLHMSSPSTTRLHNFAGRELTELCYPQIIQISKSASP